MQFLKNSSKWKKFKTPIIVISIFFFTIFTIILVIKNISLDVDGVRNLLHSSYPDLTYSNLEIQKSGFDIKLNFRNCDWKGIKTEKLITVVDLKNTIQKRQIIFSQMLFENMQINIQKENDDFFILDKNKKIILSDIFQKSKYQSQNIRINFNDIINNIKINSIKINNSTISIANQKNILFFNKISLKNDEDKNIIISGKLNSDKINSGIEIKINQTNEEGILKLSVNNFPFEIAKYLTGMSDFFQSGISKCEINARYNASGIIGTEFNISCNLGNILINKEKIPYKTILINGSSSIGIIALEDVVVKFLDSDLAINNIKISENEIFFDSNFTINNVKNKIILNQIHQICEKFTFLNIENIKKAELNLNGIYSASLQKKPILKSGNIDFKKSRLVFSPNLILKNTNGNCKILNGKIDSLCLNSGVLNNLNNFNKCLIKNLSDKIKIKISGNFDAEYLSSLINNQDLFNKFNLKNIQGVLSGDLTFVLNKSNRELIATNFHGNGEFNFQNPYEKNADEVLKINCNIDIDSPEVLLSGKIFDEKNTDIHFNYDKKLEQILFNFSGNCDSEILNIFLGENFVNGKIAIIQGKISSNNNKNITSSISLNMQNAKIYAPSFLEIKQINDPGIMELSSQENMGSGTRVTKNINFSINTKGTLYNGRLNFCDESLNAFKMSCEGGENFESHGTLIDDSWHVDIAGKNFTLKNCEILKQNNSFEAILSIDKCTCKTIFDKDFSIRGYLTKKNGVIKKADFQCASSNGEKLNVKTDSYYYAPQLMISGTNCKKMLAAIGFPNPKVEGNFTFQLKQSQNLSDFWGKLSINNCIIRDSAILSKIITFSIPLASHGIESCPFHEIDCDFTLKNGVLNIYELIANGKLLKVTTQGGVNFKTKNLNLKGKITPANEKEGIKYKIDGDIESPLLKISSPKK